jgi:hypothetical protein
LAFQWSWGRHEPNIRKSSTAIKRRQELQYNEIELSREEGQSGEIKDDSQSAAWMLDAGMSTINT